MASLMWRLITETKTKNLEKTTATHSSILAWKIPWTEEPGGLQFIGLQSQTQLKQLSAHKTKNWVILRAIQLRNLENLHLWFQKSRKDIFIFVTLNGLQRNIYLGTCLAVQLLRL